MACPAEPILKQTKNIMNMDAILALTRLPKDLTESLLEVLDRTRMARQWMSSSATRRFWVEIKCALNLAINMLMTLCKLYEGRVPAKRFGLLLV